MYFKQILHEETGCSAYFVASRETREAAVIDPQEGSGYLDISKERDYHLIHVIDTHIHADHISCGRQAAMMGGARYYLHESADVNFPHRTVTDGQVLKLGQIELKIVHTSGHRPESISILITNKERSPEPSMVLSGDTLFVGDVGRPDGGGPRGAEDEWESIQKLLALPDYVEVFPAHFEGSCGKHMCGRPSSTIGFERRFNPVLQLSRDEFLKYAREVSPRPLNMTRNIAVNKGEMDYLFGNPPPPVEVDNIDSFDAPAWIDERTPFILDVREPEEYGAGHIPGAVSIPQADLALRLDEVPGDRDVLVVCAAGARSALASTFLKREGRQRITNLEGGTNGWVEEGHQLER